MKLTTVLAVGALCLMLAGCGTTTVSPLGSDQYAIECLDSVSYCAAKANEVCKDGMDVVSTSGKPAHMIMVVRCKGTGGGA